jgi:hypothetical protein
VSANTTWKLTETWNEWGEGTAVEPGSEVSQATGSGTAVINPEGVVFQNSYVDILNTILPVLPQGTGAEANTIPEQSSNSPSTSAPGISLCTATSPSGSPNLYEIDTGKNTATLYFSPAGKPNDYYYVAYGLKPYAEQYGVDFSQGYSTGAIKYTINMLNPGTTYYFKVRGGNGCATGNWSGIVAATTGYSRKFYPGGSPVIKQKVKYTGTTAIIEPEVELITTPEPTPQITPTAVNPLPTQAFEKIQLPIPVVVDNNTAQPKQNIFSKVFHSIIGFITNIFK